MEENNMVNQLKPFLNIGPGQIIKREMEALNWNQEDLAQILEMSPKSINHILSNKQSITVDTATLLGKAFKNSPDFWLNLEKNYRLRLKSEGEKEKDTELKAEIRKYMPMLEMRKKLWIKFDNTTVSQKKAYCKFWELETPDFSVYESDDLQLCARQAKDDEIYTKYYTQTWLKKAQIEAAKIEVPAFNKNKLDKMLKQIIGYAGCDNNIENFINELNAIGVKFIILSHLEKTYLDGAAFMSGKNPTVVFTGRHKGVDSFWWTITHELSHVLLHLQNDNNCFIDNLDNPVYNEMEIEADQLTANLLKKDEIIQAVNRSQHFTEQKLLDISNKLLLHPAIVLGILQFEKKVTYRTRLNKYKTPVSDLLPKRYFKG